MFMHALPSERFHGRVDAVNHFKRQWDKPAVAIFLAWQSDTCVGISELASDAHLAVLVEHHWQGRGVGSRLLRAVVGEAAVKIEPRSDDHQS